MRGFLRGAIELLLPPACGGCGGAVPPDAVLCRPCDAALERLAHDACRLCQAHPPAPGRSACAGCRARRPPFVCCAAAVVFAGLAADFVHRFKYPAAGLAGLDPGPGAVARALVREAARRLPGPPPGAVVPVPLHRRRLAERGFNPAASLARAVAREIGAPVAPRLLLRVRDTPSQTGLDRKARRRNVAGAFALARGGRVPERVWLVDDVVTTGSTLAEAARVLRRGGSRVVLAVCVARTLSLSG